jgi:hypothetical protein
MKYFICIRYTQTVQTGCGPPPNTIDDTEIDHIEHYWRGTL